MEKTTLRFYTRSKKSVADNSVTLRVVATHNDLRRYACITLQPFGARHFADYYQPSGQRRTDTDLGNLGAAGALLDEQVRIATSAVRSVVAQNSDNDAWASMTSQEFCKRVNTTFAALGGGECWRDYFTAPRA